MPQALVGVLSSQVVVARHLRGPGERGRLSHVVICSWLCGLNVRSYLVVVHVSAVLDRKLDVGDAAPAPVLALLDCLGQLVGEDLNGWVGWNNALGMVSNF